MRRARTRARMTSGLHVRPATSGLLLGLTAFVSGCDSEDSVKHASEVAKFRCDSEREAAGTEVVHCYVGEALVQSTWFEATGSPLIRTSWLEDGYGHIFEFSAAGELVEVCEGRRGVRSGAAIRLARDGSVAEALWYEDGERVTRPDQPTPEALIGLDLAELHPRDYSHGDDANEVHLREYLAGDRVVAAVWMRPSGQILMASRFGSGDAGETFFWREGKLRLIAQSAFDVLDGLAIEWLDDGTSRTVVFVRGRRMAAPEED